MLKESGGTNTGGNVDLAQEAVLTLDDLKSAVAESSGLTKAQAGQAIAALVEAVQDGLARGQKVTITNFGSFEVSERAARMGRNPQTGASIRIPPSKNVKFKAGKQLKQAVSG